MTSSSKKPNALLAAINRAAPVNEPSPATAPYDSESLSDQRSVPVAQRSSRVGTKLVAGHFDPRIARQLRMIAAEEDTTVQSLLEEALDLLFVKKGKARLDEIARA